MQSFEQAQAYIYALTGSVDAAMDWRCIHDSDKSAPAHARRGSLSEWWQWLCEMQQSGHGVFNTVAQMDGAGRELENVQAVRAHYIDCDSGSVEANVQRAAQSIPPPCFKVNSSPGKAHVYWPLSEWYNDNERFTALQRRLRQTYDSDRNVIDATRVMRTPGFYHLKADPWLVTCEQMPGYLQRTTVQTLEQAYAHVHIIDGGAGERHELGEPELAAPSLEWLKHAMALIDPNSLDRLQWISTTAAIKQAGWSITTPETLYAAWSDWCGRYEKNDTLENKKQWGSIKKTELGWPTLTKRLPTLRASMAFGTEALPFTVNTAATPPMPVNAPPPLDCSGEMLTHIEQQEYFKGCVWVTKLGQILVPDGRFLNASQFNGSYGGKQFVFNSQGKQTDEAWKAALRGTQWRIPSVDHVRFLPHEPHGTIVKDDLGRKGVNTYKPAQTRRVEGDAGPFLRHIAAMLPDERDQSVLIAYLAHNVRYPGHKIPWAPVIQSVEGVGKGIIKELMLHALGRIYTHYPNAQELTNSGSTFNGWMRNKLFILADEIKVDDRRDLIEVLKPMISESLIEVQSKGVDQELEDNYANWLFFSNWKDAVPVSKNGRRYAVFFSPIQTEADLLARGMGEDYFNALYGWMKADGAAIVTDWLHRYPIERGAIPMRAPKTSSWDEAVKIGRSPVERVIQEAVDDQIPGFRGGWVSVLAAAKRVRVQGAARGNVPPHVIHGILEGMGYVTSGRAPRMYAQDDVEQKTDLFHFRVQADPQMYGRDQGYE